MKGHRSTSRVSTGPSVNDGVPELILPKQPKDQRIIPSGRQHSCETLVA